MPGTQPLLAAKDGRATTAKKVSLAAARLLRRIKEHPDGACELRELAQELRMSKAACARALRELDYAGLINLHVEED